MGERDNLNFLLERTPTSDSRYFVAYYVGVCEILVHANTQRETLTGLLTMDPRDFDDKLPGRTMALVHDVQGRLKERLGDIDGAENSYRALIAAHESRPAYARFGVLLMASRALPSEALTIFDKANECEGRLEYTGVDAIVSYYRGVSHEQLGDMDGAEQAYREVMQNDPGGSWMGISAWASLALATIYANQSLAQESEIDPMRPLGYFQRAIDGTSYVRARLEAYKRCVSYLLKKNLLLIDSEKMLCKMIGLAWEESEPDYLQTGYSMYASIHSALGNTKGASHFSKAAKAIAEGLGR